MVRASLCICINRRVNTHNGRTSTRYPTGCSYCMQRVFGRDARSSSWLLYIRSKIPASIPRAPPIKSRSALLMSGNDRIEVIIHQMGRDTSRFLISRMRAPLHHFQDAPLQVFDVRPYLSSGCFFTLRYIYDPVRASLRRFP